MQVMPNLQNNFRRGNKMRRSVLVATQRFSAVLPRFNWVLLVSVLSAFFGLSVAMAQTSGDVPVTNTIRDFVDWTDPDSGTTQRIQMQVQSDGAGVYTTIPGAKRGQFRVESVIRSNGGEWVLNTGINLTSPTRKAFLDLSHPIAGSGPGGSNPAPPFSTALVQPKLESECWQYGVNMFSIEGGQTVSCPLRIGFYYPIGGSNLYRIFMTPDDRSFNPYPETDHVNVTCRGEDASSQCNQWRIEPDGEKGGCLTPDCSVKQNVVKLVKVVTVKGHPTNVDLGDFLMTFSVDVTNP